jgi:hypothetical protein
MTFSHFVAPLAIVRLRPRLHRRDEATWWKQAASDAIGTSYGGTMPGSKVDDRNRALDSLQADAIVSCPDQPGASTSPSIGFS